MEILARSFEIVLLLGGILLFIPSAFLLVECLVAPRHNPPKPLRADPLPRTTLLIPAHNEEAGIASTLASVFAAIFPQLEMLVVADNCTDATAALARQYGAQVIERSDPAHIGKGYALAFGVEFLKTDPPDIVIVLDADCLVQVDALKYLAHSVLDTARPVQAVYTLQSVPEASSKTAVSNFAFLVKNLVRPAGLAQLGAPCFLTGSGMAFPWSILSKLPLASGHLSEDMWLSVLLACEGQAPRLSSNAFVYGTPPRRDNSLQTQRARWERGHLQTMGRGIPRLVRAAFTLQSAEPLWLALELSVPPLALLLLIVTLLLLVSALGAALGLSVAPLIIALLNLILVFAAGLAVWWKFGRTDLSAQTLLAVPGYILWKIPLHFNTLFRTRVSWTRTDRDPSAGGEG